VLNTVASPPVDSCCFFLLAMRILVGIYEHAYEMLIVSKLFCLQHQPSPWFYRK
jgi:hypothetical protein